MIFSRCVSLFFPAVLFIGCGTGQIRKSEEKSPAEIVASEEKPVVVPPEIITPVEVPQKSGSLKIQPPTLKKEGKKKSGRFNFSGDEFVKETGLNPFEKKKNDAIIRLKGHAHVSSRNLRMSSPQIEIYGDNGRMAYAKGPVEIVDTRDDTRITADEALFIRAENRAVMRGNARLVANIKNKKKTAKNSGKQKMTLTSNEMERNFETSVSTARGDVVATSASGVLYAHQAEFVEPEDLMRSQSDPRIFTASDLFLADSIQWNIATNTADFHGHVRAYFSRVDGLSNGAQKKNPVESAVRSEEGTLIQRADLPFGQKLTLRKKVSLERKNYSAYSDEAEIFGSGGELVKAKDHVVLVNGEENSKSYGDFFEWLKETGFMSLTARKNSRTRTILHNKQSVPTAEIAAASVTRATAEANPQARGNVQIIQFAKEKNANPVRMGGEWAEMRRLEKVIQLYGAPYVEGELGRIGARDIILYYEEQRYEMLGIRPGVVEKRMNYPEGNYE
jgi:lipopolysaccharide export system protein LptA